MDADPGNRTHGESSRREPRGSTPGPAVIARRRPVFEAGAVPEVDVLGAVVVPPGVVAGWLALLRQPGSLSERPGIETLWKRVVIHRHALVPRHVPHDTIHGALAEARCTVTHARRGRWVRGVGVAGVLERRSRRVRSATRPPADLGDGRRRWRSGRRVELVGHGRHPGTTNLIASPFAPGGRRVTRDVRVRVPAPRAHAWPPGCERRHSDAGAGRRIPSGAVGARRPRVRHAVLHARSHGATSFGRRLG